MKQAVVNLDNKNVGEVNLDASVFGKEVRPDVIHRVINWQLNKRRSGNHKTKGMSEVSGPNQKPWRQKGTGRARAGNTKRPQDRGGGVVFGPVVRSHATDLPKKIRAFALKSALSAKVKNGKLIVLDKAVASSHKTAPIAKSLSGLGANNALIVAGNEVDTNFARATKNIANIDVVPSKGANVYDIIRRDVLILTEDAVKELTERLKG